MDVLLNGRFLTQPFAGVPRYAYQLLGALDQLIEQKEFDLCDLNWKCLTPKAFTLPPTWKHIPVQSVGYLGGNIWEQLDLLLTTRGQLLVNLGNLGPLLKSKQAAIFHDASVFAVPEAYSLPYRLKHRFGLRLLGRTARVIFTSSEFSRQELARYAWMKPQKVQVLAGGCEHILSVPADRQVLARHDLENRPYLLVVSNLSPHKNLAGLVRALELISDLPFEVVFAGITYAPVFQLGGQPLPAAIRQIGPVTDGELRALYEGATAFIFPSLYEGFGLPPLEAMACGCPVIVSRAASLPEVCGEAAVYCDPRDPQDIARQIERVMSDSTLRDQLRQKGLERAGRFTWAETARRFVNGLKSTLH